MEDFNSLDNAGKEAGAEVNIVDAAAKEDKKAKVKKMMALLQETIAADTSLIQRMKTLSQSVSVVNTLGYGDKGNIVVDKSGPSKGPERKLLDTSKIVGYRVQNIGTTPIQYVTEDYAVNEAGVWEGTQVTKFLEPGATADFTRKYMTIFCSQPEISFLLANGKIVRGSGTVKGGDVDAELEAHYFSFSDTSIKVNSDEVKLNIAQKAKQPDGTSKWVIRPEFEQTFGYINNVKTPTKKAKSKKDSDLTQAAAANYIQTLLKNRGKM